MSFFLSFGASLFSFFYLWEASFAYLFTYFCLLYFKNSLTQLLTRNCWEDQVIIEIKSVNGIAPIHEAQLLSYLRLYGTCTRGLLINFNVKRLVEGIRRMKIWPSLCVFCGLCGSFNCWSVSTLKFFRQSKLREIVYLKDFEQALRLWNIKDLTFLCASTIHLAKV